MNVNVVTIAIIVFVIDFLVMTFRMHASLTSIDASLKDIAQHLKTAAK